MSFDLVSCTMGMANGSRSGGAATVAPVFAGYSWGYVATGGGEFCSDNDNKNKYLTAYMVAANRTYLCVIGDVISNKWRPAVYYDKTLDDFMPYIDTATAWKKQYTASIDLVADLNTDPSGATLRIRVIFTPASDGILMVQTSAIHQEAPPWLFDVTGI